MALLGLRGDVSTRSRFVRCSSAALWAYVSDYYYRVVGGDEVLLSTSFGIFHVRRFHVHLSLFIFSHEHHYSLLSFHHPESTQTSTSIVPGTIGTTKPSR